MLACDAATLSLFNCRLCQFYFSLSGLLLPFFLHSDVSSRLPLCFRLLILFKWRKERGFSFRGVTRCVNGSRAEWSWQASSTRGPGERRVGSAPRDCSVLVWTCRKETQQGMLSVMNDFTSDGGFLSAFHTFPLVLKAVLQQDSCFLIKETNNQKS